MLVCGEREAMVMAPPLMHDSAVSPCFHGCQVFLHRHFPPQSPPSHPLYLSVHSQQQPSHWDCSTIPKLQLPATVPSRRPMFLPCIYMAVARTAWFSFHLGCHRSAVSLSALNVSPLRQLPCCGDQTPTSVPPPTRGRSSPTNTPVFPPSSFVLLSFACLYLFFWRRQWHPLQYSCLENPMDEEAWWAAVHGIAKSWTRLSDFTFTFHLHALEKAMATHSSVLALENPRDGWAWWAAVYGVTQSRIRLKRLSSSIYSFQVRSSCPLSARVLHARLCLKMYSWCTCGERCAPRPPTPLPSCSPMVSVLMSSSFIHCFTQQNLIEHF